MGNTQPLPHTNPQHTNRMRRLGMLVIVIGLPLWAVLHLVYGFARPVAGATASPVHNQERPEEPEPLRDITDLTAGGSHTCAVDDMGQVWCWGINYYGQLGDNTMMSRSGAVPVIGLAGKAAAVSAGMFNSCALLVDGVVQCWGMHDQNRPITVTGWNGKATAITAGRRNCALTDSAEVYCWHDSGPQATHQSALTETIRAVTAGYEHVCALTERGGVRCWGWNYTGQLGDGTTTESETPVPVKGLETGVVAIDSEANTTCALTDAGAVLCWGAGPLGNGAISFSVEPAPVAALDEAVMELAMGYDHSCVRTVTGKIYCWGNNHFGQVGGGDPTHELSIVNAAGSPVGYAAVKGAGVLVKRRMSATRRLQPGNTATIMSKPSNGSALGSYPTTRPCPTISLPSAPGCWPIPMIQRHGLRVPPGIVSKQLRRYRRCRPLCAAFLGRTGKPATIARSALPRSFRQDKLI